MKASPRWPALPARSRTSVDERALAFLLGAVPIAVLGAADGGFFRSTWPWATSGLAAAGGIVLLLRERIVLGRHDLLAVAALAALAAWIALSALWSDDPRQSLLEGERALVYVSGLLTALLFLRDDLVVPLLAGLLTAITAVALTSLAGGRADGGPFEGPIGYANALGVLAAIGLPLSLGISLRVAEWVARLAALGVAPVLLATLVLTGSRGAWLALAAGLVVALALARPRTALITAPLVAAASIVAVASVDLGDRPYYWHAAWEQYRTHPLTGSGAGTFDRYWLVHRPEDLTLLDTPQVLDAHSLYLEMLAELGPLGLALLAVALGIPVLTALRRGRGRWFAGAAAAYFVYLAHAGLDWDWEMPVVTLAALLCAASLVAARRREDEIVLGRRARAGLIALMAAMIALSLASILV